MNTIQKTYKDVLIELERARIKFAEWPTDPLHAYAVVQEEVGEAQKEILQLCYEPHKTSREEIYKEVIQATAMMYRFLESFDRYDFSPGEQHEQEE